MLELDIAQQCDVQIREMGRPVFRILRFYNGLFQDSLWSLSVKGLDIFWENREWSLTMQWSW